MKRGLRKIILLCLLALIFLLWLSGSNKKIPLKKVIVLSPHFDDAALSLGGFMAKQKAPPLVATFFAGKPVAALRGHWDSISGFRDSSEAVAQRTKENDEALAAVGAEVLNFPYLDFQYRQVRGDSDTASIQKSIEQDIGGIISRYASGAMDIYGPAEFGAAVTHPDHKILHDAFTSVAREKLGQKNLRFFYYEDFPYVKRYDNATTTSLKDFLEQQNGGVSLSETPLPIYPAALDKKIKAIEAYSSQEKAFRSFGKNIEQAAREYARGRCSNLLPKPFACEVVYEIKKTTANSTRLK